MGRGTLWFVFVCDTGNERGCPSEAWLPDGTSATLTDAGFQAVISQRSEQELDVYIRRVITARGGRVLDDSGLTAFASLHSKEQNMRNLTQLQVELHKTPLFEDWLTFSSSTVGRMTRFSTAQVDHLFDGMFSPTSSQGTECLRRGETVR